MIFGCLTSIIALIFAFVMTIVILAITGVAITFGLLARLLIPFILIAIGIKVISNNRR
ncbi:hypothetical protein [Schnuerera sp.]|uniref:hypothetical protein n=1 Tax=Schnuerera sp. TaxID=2794844 RepID=UPI002CD6A080|nr:hypothetical protein [Schnuerera sp.]HSH35551.1 hypothetical protein [Schnuerera sp.]